MTCAFIERFSRSRHDVLMMLYRARIFWLSCAQDARYPDFTAGDDFNDRRSTRDRSITDFNVKLLGFEPDIVVVQLNTLRHSGGYCPPLMGFREWGKEEGVVFNKQRTQCCKWSVVVVR